MRCVLWGMVGVIILYGQGWEGVRDSLLIENERIESLEMEQRPIPEVPRLERPMWRMEAPSWEGVPAFPMYMPSVIQPTRPSWTKLAPLHVRYGVGRYWTQTVAASWGRTRDLSADEGLSLTHTSTPVGHVARARWGHTHLSGWMGRYTERTGWEVAYRGGYEKFIYYAPYAEKWSGFIVSDPIPDSLKGHYFRQELRCRAFDRDIGELFLETRRLDFRRGAPEWQASLRANSRAYAIRGWRTHAQADVFVEGGRFVFGIEGIAEKTFPQWEIRAGLRTALGRDSSLKAVGSPLLRVVYTGINPLLRPYLEMRGDMRPLTYFYASELNPYLRRETQRLPLSREWVHAQAGFQGQGRGWDYRLAAEYRFSQQTLLFVPNGAAFDLRSISTFQSLGAVLQAVYVPLPQGPSIELRGIYRSWQATQTYFSLAPWEIWLRGVYKSHDKLMIALSAYGIGQRSLSPDTQAPAFVDISWEAHAQILPFLSIFAEMNNLLNRRFYRWHAYVERPLDFRLGIWLKLG